MAWQIWLLELQWIRVARGPSATWVKHLPERDFQVKAEQGGTRTRTPTPHCRPNQYPSPLPPTHGRLTLAVHLDEHAGCTCSWQAPDPPMWTVWQRGSLGRAPEGLPAQCKQRAQATGSWEDWGPHCRGAPFAPGNGDTHASQVSTGHSTEARLSQRWRGTLRPGPGSLPDLSHRRGGAEAVAAASRLPKARAVSRLAPAGRRLAEHPWPQAARRPTASPGPTHSQ